ncbi:hypothetical protein IV203_024773 [Nitzschia inconspicua]|uniref:Uncharacterized protein n=1 Tax=Nitzschia inconspicua TaxID=303405 RepID=A0A9K3PC92_9STRA|nr:hypothetical protein IV203_024773 [Nitzschia inconspicua]
MSFGSSSTSSSLLTASTWGDKIVSLILFYGSYLFLGKIRSIGVSNLPMAIRLLISMMGKKSNSLTNSKGKDNVTSEMSCSNHKTDDKIRTVGSTTTNATNNLTNPSSWDDVCHKVWTYLQASSVVSGLFNIYPYVIIKWNAMFHIVLVVKESMEHRYATQLEHQRIIREREEKRQRMLDFWRRWLPRFLFEWIFLRKQRKTTKQQNNDKGDDEAATPASPVKAGTSMSTSTSTSTGKRFVGLRKRNKEMPAAETICTKTPLLLLKQPHCLPPRRHRHPHQYHRLSSKKRSDSTYKRPSSSYKDIESLTWMTLSGASYKLRSSTMIGPIGKRVW